MKAEEHKQITNAILQSLGDQGKVSELLLKLEEGNTVLEEGYTKLVGDHKTLQDNNESLRAANNKLFIRLGAEESAPPKQVDDPTPEVAAPQELKFEDLFNEKGELI